MLNRDMVETFGNEFYATLSTDIQELVSSVEISTLDEELNNVAAERKNEPCIVVLLRRELPSHLTLPESYRDVAVCWDIGGFRMH